MNRTSRIVALSSAIADVIEFRNPEDESRLGNTVRGNLIGGGIAAGIGAGVGATMAPGASKKWLREMRKTGSLGSTIPRTAETKGLRGNMAWFLKQYRSMAKGGVAGRSKGALLGAVTYGGLGAGIGTIAGALRRPRTANELNALLTDIIEFRSQEVDENGFPILGTAVGVGAGAGAVYGGVKGHQAIMGRYGNGMLQTNPNGISGFRQGTVREAYGNAYNDVRGRVGSMFGGGVDSVKDASASAQDSGLGIKAKRMFGQAKDWAVDKGQRAYNYADNVGERLGNVARRHKAGAPLMNNLKVAARSISKVRFEAGNDGIIALNAELRDILTMG